LTPVSAAVWVRCVVAEVEAEVTRGRRWAVERDALTSLYVAVQGSSLSVETVRVLLEGFPACQERLLGGLVEAGRDPSVWADVWSLPMFVRWCRRLSDPSVVERQLRRFAAAGPAAALSPSCVHPQVSSSTSSQVDVWDVRHLADGVVDGQGDRVLLDEGVVTDFLLGVFGDAVAVLVANGVAVPERVCAHGWGVLERKMAAGWFLPSASSAVSEAELALLKLQVPERVPEAWLRLMTRVVHLYPGEVPVSLRPAAGRRLMEDGLSVEQLQVFAAGCESSKSFADALAVAKVLGAVTVPS
jgi:hypothetical protein